MLFSSKDPQKFNHQFQILNGMKYHYIDEGMGHPVLLLHGFPDLWFGWRFQIDYLSKNGFRVIVPDLLGFGLTDAPQDLRRYTFRSVSQDLVQLMASLQCNRFYLVGHDWGGATAWRLAQYYPERIIKLACICASFYKTTPQYLSLDEIIKIVPNLAYQKALAQEETTSILDSDPKAFFKLLFHDKGFIPPKSHPLAKFFEISPMKVVPNLSYHIEVYSQKGFRGPLNWYRTRKLNHSEEKESNIGPVLCPCMLILASRDPYLTPEMAKSIKRDVPHCQVREIDASHWAMVENPTAINELLVDWFSLTFKL